MYDLAAATDHLWFCLCFREMPFLTLIGYVHISNVCSKCTGQRPKETFSHELTDTFFISVSLGKIKRVRGGFDSPLFTANALRC